MVAVFCTKYLRIPSSQICTTLAAPKPGPFAKLLGSSGIVAAPVFSGQNVQSESTDASLLDIGEN